MEDGRSAELAGACAEEAAWADHRDGIAAGGEEEAKSKQELFDKSKHQSSKTGGVSPIANDEFKKSEMVR